MEKETERISKSLAIVERQINELKDSGNKTALDILRKKEARLKEELKGTQMSTNALAKSLLAQRKNIKGLSKIEFNDLIRRLSKRPEYSFLKTMPKDKIKTDLERTAKPVGWRFKGRGNYDKPTAKQIVAGKKSGTVYNERRPLHSDVSQVVKLKEGGNLDDSSVNKLINDQITYILSLKTVKDKKDAINVLINNLEDWSSSMSKTITLDNLKYALKQTTVSKVNEVLKTSLNALKMKQGGKIDVKPYEFTKDGKTIMINGTQSDIKKMYLDYVNNFLTISAFADHYDISDKQAENIISKGKELSESSGTYENGGNIEYSQGILDFNKDLRKLDSVKKLASYYKLSIDEIVKKLQRNLVVKKYDNDRVKTISIDYTDTTSKINVRLLEAYEKTNSTSNKPSSSSELYIKTIAEKTATRPLAVKKFVEYHKLTDNQVLNLMQGIGMGTIKASDFASAIVGDKVSEKAIVKFAKSKEAFKTPKTITASALKDASYVSNRDIVSLTIKKGSDTITINGNDILDGVYLKNNITMSAPKESASDIVLKIITKAKELDKKVPFWGNLKEKMTIVTAPRVQKLLDAGYDTKEIMLIYLGINSVYDVTIDNEFTYNAISGLFDYEPSYVDTMINRYVDVANVNQYELGLKYPEIDWDAIIKKYNISKTPRAISEEKRTRGNEETRHIYSIYEGDDVVISTTANRERWIDGKKQPKDSYYFRKPITDGNFKDGYWGITSSKKEVIMDVLSMIVTQNVGSYVKEIAVFVNNLGGADAETLVQNKIKFEQGGNIGRTISFMDWRGDVRKGVITERLKKGYEVMTPQGVALVEDSEIIE